MNEPAQSEDVYKFNLKALSHDKNLRNIESILITLNFGALATFNTHGLFWSYLKVKGPVFIVVDSFRQLKIAILNQLSTENYVFRVSINQCRFKTTLNSN